MNYKALRNWTKMNLKNLNKKFMATDTKTVLSLNKPVPNWAKWAYRSVFFLTTILAGWVAGTNLISQSNKFEFMLILKLIDPVIYGLAQFLGEEDIVASFVTKKPQA